MTPSKIFTISLGFVITYVAVVGANSLLRSGAEATYVWSNLKLDTKLVASAAASSRRFATYLLDGPADDNVASLLSVADSEKPDVVIAYVGKSINGVSSSIKDVVGVAESSVTLDDLPLEVQTESLVGAFLSKFGKVSSATDKTGRVAFVGDCNVDFTGGSLLATLEDLNVFFETRGPSEHVKKTDLLLVCDGMASVDNPLHAVQEAVKEANLKYVAVYTPETWGLPSTDEKSRRSVLTNSKKKPLKSFADCDPACQIRAFVWETIFVAITLLIILCCGLCCMAGIDTPARFEAPKES